MAYVAGLITSTAMQSMNTRIVNSNMIYGVILIVVLGGLACREVAATCAM